MYPFLAPRQRHVVLALAMTQIADGLFNAVAKNWVLKDLNHLRLPEDLRLAFPVVKAGSAVGLLAGTRFRRLGRLTSGLLVVYFVLALAAHLRVGDPPRRCVAALAMLAWAFLSWRTMDRRNW